MLETEIKANTAALASLAAAVGELVAILKAQVPAAAISQQAPAPAAPEQPKVAPAPVAPAPVAPAPVVPAPVAPAAPAPAVPEQPKVAPAPVAPAPAITGDELRKLCVKAGAAGLTAEVVQFLSDHGVAKLAALPPADYPALVALLKSKGVE